MLAPENIPQEGAQRGGHVPGAKNVPWATAVTEDGTFKGASYLAAVHSAVGNGPDSSVITYCRTRRWPAHH